MKRLRQGLVGFIVIYLMLAYMVGCSHFHHVEFLNDACIIPFHKYDYRTCEIIQVEVDGVFYNIPKNFKTDLASIPRVLWPVFAPQYSGFVAPAILHDYYYRCNNSITRKYADEVLYSALISQNVSALTASKFYIGVRLFGGFHFNKDGGDC